MHTDDAALSMRLVQNVQWHLQQRYDLQLPYQVAAFVCHDSAQMSELGAGHAVRQENLLVHQSDDELNFSLFLDADTLDQANQALQASRIQAGELDSVCAVVEGVSHALCLLWHAHHDRQIRAIDLELQAEVDKYLLLSRILADPDQCHELIARLFEQVRYEDDDAALQERYRQANDHAAQYCRHLHGRYRSPAEYAAFSRELCRFYRLSGWKKWRHIRQCH